MAIMDSKNRNIFEKYLTVFENLRANSPDSFRPPLVRSFFFSVSKGPFTL